MSKALAVKKALRDKLMSRPELAGIQVTYGIPAGQLERSWIALHDIEWTSAEWVTTGHRRVEEFTVAVVVNVQIGGGTSEEAEDAAFTLASYLEAELTADPGIDGLCVSSGYVPRRVKSWSIPTGIETQYEIEVTATCRP